MITSPAVSQTIETIDIKGNSEFSKSDYLGWIRINPGMDYFPGISDSIKNRIGRELQNRGYFNYSFQSIDTALSPDSQQVNIVVAVNEGKPANISRISVYGLSSADSVIVLPRLQFLEGEVFNKIQIENAFSEIMDDYENSGFPFASIIIQSIVVEHDANNTYMDIYLIFDKGKKSTIDKIEIIGNNKTADRVVLRAARLFPPVTYSQDRIDNIPKRLNRLRFFQPVNQPVFYFDAQNRGVLQITVEEKQTNNFDGIVGYVPGDEESAGYFTGFVNINMRNLFGTGRALGLKWNKEELNSQELEIKYLEPWIFNYPFNIEAGFFQRKQDTTYVQRMFESSIQFLATEDISASFLFSTESIIPTENDDNVFTVYNSSIITTGGQVEVDNRDDFYSPTEGVYFSTVYKYSSKSINGPGEFVTPETITETSLQRFELDFLYFIEPFTRQIIYTGIHGRELRGNLFEISDLYRLGGTNTLRGYKENQFLGNRIFWSNTEYRYLLTRRTFAFIFFDTGYYLRNAEPERRITELSSFKYGYGLGLNLETGLGVLGVSFALGEGDSFSQGKIHFGIINEF